MIARWAAALALACVIGCGGGSSAPRDGGPGGAGAAGTGAAGAGAGTGGGAGGTGSAGTGAAGAGMAGTGAAGTQVPDAAADSATDAPAASDASDAGPPVVDAGPSSKRQTPRPLGTNGAPNGYFEYLPPGYDGQAATPLLVFWHGVGEDGNGTTDLAKVLAWGLPKLIAADKWPAARPFIVLSPQYVPASGEIAPGGGCPSGATIDTFLTWALAHYKVDPKRVYVTGLSCGAIGTWDYLARFKGAVVAAAVPLSGNPGDPTQPTSAWKRAMCGLGEVAIWSFHGDADDAVPYAPDHDTVDLIKACAMPPRRDARFTDIVAGGHMIWDPIYDLSGGSGDIYAWMLANAKP